MDFLQESERFKDVQVRNYREITDLKLMKPQGRMRSAVAATIATIMILMLFKGGSGALVRGRDGVMLCFVA